MVTTFLVDVDFRRSAAKLNTARLGKQRVEAQQILNLCLNLHLLARLFNIQQFPVNTFVPKTIRSEWVTAIVTEFKKLHCVALGYSTNGIRLFYNKSQIPRRIASNERLVQHENLFYVYDLTKNKYITSGPTDQFIHPNEQYISLGYIHHPAVIMWLGYEEALKDYINAHIEIWIARGYKNTMSLHNITSPIIMPFWCNNETVKMFQASLLQRELERAETPWYILQQEFILSFTGDVEKANYLDQVLSSGLLAENRTALLNLSSFQGLIWP